MDIDKLSDMPEWDDDVFLPEEGEGDEWKENATRDACKALYAKWREVVFLLRGIINPYLEKEGEDMDMMQFTARDLYGDAHMVAAKIRSSEAGGIYVIRMENAAIIRKLAQGIATSLLLFLEDGDVDENYVMVVRDEITAFRKLFIVWVNTFERDEFEDEWGLFV